MSIPRDVVAAGAAWRPHTKAVRAPELAQRMVAAGAVGVICATVAEAEAMVAGGVGDVLR